MAIFHSYVSLPEGKNGPSRIKNHASASTLGTNRGAVAQHQSGVYCIHALVESDEQPFVDTADQQIYAVEQSQKRSFTRFQDGERYMYVHHI